MGLDQYWVKNNPVEWGKQWDDRWEKPGFDWNEYREEREKNHEFFYHRKVPALQAFMRHIWEEQGGVHKKDDWGDSFNTSENYVVVNEDVLDRLEKACAKTGTKSGLDTKASGFFWGSHYPEDVPQILEAVQKARAILAEGGEVYYYSSW